MAKQDFHLPQEWKERLKEEAERRASSVSQVIRDAIYETYVKGESEEVKFNSN